MLDSVNLMNSPPTFAKVTDLSKRFDSSLKNATPGLSFADTLKGESTEEIKTTLPRSAKVAELYRGLANGSPDGEEWADNTAFLYGCETVDSPLLYVGEWPTIRIAATGEIYTPEKQAYFKEIAELYHGGRVELYKNELAKGTPPLEIIDKIFDYNETLPDEFRKMSGWV